MANLPQSMVPLSVRGDVEARALKQLERCATGSAVAAALMADHHLGYSMPIGGVVAYREHISPTGVGYDIGCGNKCTLTNLRAADVPVASMMDEIVKRISFGMGRHNNEPVDHPVLEKIKNADFVPQRGMAQMAAKQLGTVGAGNHYVDLLEDENGWLWVGVHFGSRGFGHKTATGFLAMAEGRNFQDRPGKEDIESPPKLLKTDEGIGEHYIAAMTLAGEYAYAGRDVVVDKVLEILGAKPIYEVHNHHNYAWRERHYGEDVWVVRKGATPAFPGQKGFVGATMGEESVILEGANYEENPVRPEALAQRALLFSTMHGAGRLMSRSAAAGKTRKRWSCSTRDCQWVQAPGEHKPTDDKCPLCRSSKLRKVWVQDSKGRVDWANVKSHLGAIGVELRGGAADEAPEAYKRLSEVLAAHSDTITVVHRLRPLGVAMAGPDIEDPFRD